MRHHRMIRRLIFATTAFLIAMPVPAAPVTGEILDAATGEPVAARLYIQNAASEWFFAESSSVQGAAIRYAKTNWINPRAMEVHTALSAHPFRAELPHGRYTFTVERGKEYHPLTQEIVVADQPLAVKFELHRWVNMAAHGWFSGDGHVHRSLADLPTLVLAEDLNVALPQSYWAIQDNTPPSRSDKFSAIQNPAATAPGVKVNEPKIPVRLISADATHVIWPLNTEYEINRVGEKVHNLGAVFILNHREPFTLGVPPLRPIAEEAHRQGALLDMDKCNWAWSLMLVPVMNIDLFELANNHLWRTEFSFTNFNVPAPAFMNLPSEGRSGGERDWIEYGFKTYYALLDCGFRLRPTAGTASGVHPVPLGFGRVYVNCPLGFSYENWIKSLGEGRSFVTTGPMLLAEISGDTPGGEFKLDATGEHRVEIKATVLSEEPITNVEIIVNAELVSSPALEARRNAEGAFESKFASSVKLSGTSWIALRCWETRADGRIRFAHTAPSWFDVAGQLLRPRKVETQWLIDRMKEEITTCTGVLSPAAVDEYRQALRFYETLAESALSPRISAANQTLIANARHTVAALEQSGIKFSAADHTALANLETSETANVGEVIEQVLGPRTLFKVHINPEMRVKVNPGQAIPKLIRGEDKILLARIENESGTTAPLQVSVLDPGNAAGDRNWLQAEVVSAASVPVTLSSAPLEYRLVKLRSRQTGKREARISLHVGQGTQDLGFRNEVDILFQCQPAQPK